MNLKSSNEFHLAEKEGFEPSLRFKPYYSLSRGAPSASWVLLQIFHDSASPSFFQNNYASLFLLVYITIFFRFGQQFSPFLRKFFHLISSQSLFILKIAVFSPSIRLNYYLDMPLAALGGTLPTEQTPFVALRRFPPFHRGNSPQKRKREKQFNRRSIKSSLYTIHYMLRVFPRNV